MSVISMRNIEPGKYPQRKNKTVDIHIEELPVRKIHAMRNNRERHKFIRQCESAIRSSLEYKDYIKLITNKFNLVHCAVLPGITKGNGKKYSIEIHHEPFGLYDIVDLEILRREDEGEPLSVLAIAESVMALHYDGMVGLIPLSKTQHQLIDSNKVFIPLQEIFFDYDKLYEHYEYYIDNKADHIKKKLELKVQASMMCDEIQSDAANPEFVYLNIDGCSLPEVKEEWITTLDRNRDTMAKEEAKEEAEKKKKLKAEAKKNKAVEKETE